MVYDESQGYAAKKNGMTDTDLRKLLESIMSIEERLNDAVMGGIDKNYRHATTAIFSRQKIVKSD